MQRGCTALIAWAFVKEISFLVILFWCTWNVLRSDARKFQPPALTGTQHYLKLQGRGLVERVLHISRQPSFLSPTRFSYTSAKLPLPDTSCQNWDGNTSDAFMTVKENHKNNQQRNPVSKWALWSLWLTVASVNKERQPATQLLMRQSTAFFPQDENSLCNVRNNVKNQFTCLIRHDRKCVPQAAKVL